MTGRFVVSLDFEKFWGMFDVVSVDEYKENLRNVDDVVDRLLELFVKYRVHATWATVGLLLHDGRDDIERYLPKDRDFYDNPSLNPYEYIKVHHSNLMSSILHQELLTKLLVLLFRKLPHIPTPIIIAWLKVKTYVISRKTLTCSVW